MGVVSAIGTMVVTAAAIVFIIEGEYFCYTLRQRRLGWTSGWNMECKNCSRHILVRHIYKLPSVGTKV